ncbi:hypothetical protein SAMN05192544_101931 [Paraburkholderia hospita]|nr:hypothetical protein SAMN05192544_101931 [Paraburkholderia hospita]
MWCLLRKRFGLLVVLLASAFCLRASCVAPVRGGTYFSLPPQRKVGKRKRLTPPTLDFHPRAPSVPTLHTAAFLFVLVANALNECLTRFECFCTGQRQRTVCAAQVANRVQVVASYTLALLQGGAHAQSVRSEACEAQEADTQFATWAAVDCLARHTGLWVREAGEALIQSAGNERGSRDCRVKCNTLWGPSGRTKN